MSAEDATQSLTSARSPESRPLGLPTGDAQGKPGQIPNHCSRRLCHSLALRFRAIGDLITNSTPESSIYSRSMAGNSLSMDSNMTQGFSMFSVSEAVSSAAPQGLALLPREPFPQGRRGRFRRRLRAQAREPGGWGHHAPSSVI